MILRTLRLLPAAAALATLLSCATGGYVPQEPSMPAARAALPPEYRIFYDALQDYGDWVLIEPYGFLYRPRADFATFRPYSDGFWAPSDTYGWVWISAEPFGWATYHYGTWFWDRYQGWVWAPGRNWSPAWVTWQVGGNYAGWAPMTPPGATDQSPGGAYLYTSMSQLGTTDLKSHLVAPATVAKAGVTTERIDGPVERDGVLVNVGPGFARVERARGGALPRVKIEEMRAAIAKSVAGRPGEPPTPTPDPVGIDAAKRAGESAAVTTRALIDRKERSPSVLRVVKAAWPKPSDAPPAPAGRAGADSTR